MQDRDTDFELNVQLILDKDSKTDLSEQIRKDVTAVLIEKGVAADTFEFGKQDAAPCLGCLLCLTKHPGVCVTKDAVNSIKKHAQDLDLTIYLTPITFGHYSSPVKNVVDRIGGSRHYQMIIGYGSDAKADEKDTFIELISKHRGSADVVHPGMDDRVDVFTVSSFEDVRQISQTLRSYLSREVPL